MAKLSKSPNKWLRCYDVVSLCRTHLLPGQIPFLHHVLPHPSQLTIVDKLIVYVYSCLPNHPPPRLAAKHSSSLVLRAHSNKLWLDCGIWSNQQMLSPHDNYYFYDSARGEEAFIGLKLPFTLPSILSLISQAVHFTKKFSYCTFIMSSIL